MFSCCQADITWRPDDVEDFNFDLKILPVPKLRELTRLIKQIRAERPGAPQTLQDRVRELEQQNEHQQRQIEEQKVQMLHMAAGLPQGQAAFGSRRPRRIAH